MTLTEHYYSLLLVSSSEKFNQSLLELLPDNRYQPVVTVPDVNTARRRIFHACGSGRDRQAPSHR